LNISTSVEQREHQTRRDPSIQDINFLGMLSMHSYMEINDSRMEDIQIGFWNPLKNLLDDDLKERKRLRSFSADEFQLMKTTEGSIGTREAYSR